MSLLGPAKFRSFHFNAWQLLCSLRSNEKSMFRYRELSAIIPVIATPKTKPSLAIEALFNILAEQLGMDTTLSELLARQDDTRKSNYSQALREKFGSEEEAARILTEGLRQHQQQAQRPTYGKKTVL